MNERAGGFHQRLERAWERNDSLLCVGLDPDPRRLPTGLDGATDAVFRFCAAIVDATAVAESVETEESDPHETAGEASQEGSDESAPEMDEQDGDEGDDGDDGKVVPLFSGDAKRGASSVDEFPSRGHRETLGMAVAWAGWRGWRGNEAGLAAAVMAWRFLAALATI